ncbi:23S rRNA (adenine(2030)-N(6))-methyltransferase RlmJ [Massilia sp. W12]|uniref:23S rRNA (adenine(2030)-N(6))-methyltransferase RlmJ n=1 Tax=Massilia sp. W12 TaxID=3126507 RepID=UPI0030CBEF94
MFSYRHAFHAGNHADVLKHMVLQQIIGYMIQKPAPLTYIDTHAGAGMYQLDGEHAMRSGEANSGVARLFALRREGQTLPPMLNEYLDLVQSMNPPARLRYYPGSPFWADRLLRDEDRLRLFELHNTDIKLLLENMQKAQQHARAQGVHSRGKRVMVHQENGFDGVKGLVPPPSRRALVLIDPPYEDKQDYRYLMRCLQECVKRFAGGTYAIWFPLLQRQESRQLAAKMQQLPGTEWLYVSLNVAAPRADGNGLTGSAMFIINPPWTLEAALRAQMPEITRLLAQDAGASFELRSGVGAFAGKRPPEDEEVQTAQPRSAAPLRPRLAGGVKAQGPLSPTLRRVRQALGEGDKTERKTGPQRGSLRQTEDAQKRRRVAGGPMPAKAPGRGPRKA